MVNYSSAVNNCEDIPRNPLPNSRTIESEIHDALKPLVEQISDEVVFCTHSRFIDYRKHAGDITYLRFPHICLPCGICLELCEFSHSPSGFSVHIVSDGYGLGIAEELVTGIRHSIQHKSQTRERMTYTRFGGWFCSIMFATCRCQVVFEHELNLYVTRILASGLGSFSSAPGVRFGTTM